MTTERRSLGPHVAYSLSPIDLIPGFIPVVEHLDDALIVPGLVFAAVRLIPPDVVQESQAQVASGQHRR